MAAGVAFLKPTRYKLVFLVEWAFFIVISAVRGQVVTPHQFLVASYPLVFFYLIACALTALSQRIHQIAQGWGLLVFAGGLVALDQTIKIAITGLIPYETSIPIVCNWLHLAHERNPHGSWVAAVLNVEFVGVYGVMHYGVIITALFFSILCHRYYIATNRRSLWVDVVLVGLLAAAVSWICDMSFRGYIVDFINLPGLTAADLKDILASIAVGATFVEMLDNPKISWRWDGWQKERDNLIRMVAGPCSFGIQELHKVQRAVTSRFKKTSGSE